MTATADRDPELESFLALLAARRAPRTVDAYRRDLTALRGWLGRPVSTATLDDLETYTAQLRADRVCGSLRVRRGSTTSAAGLSSRAPIS